MLTRIFLITLFGLFSTVTFVACDIEVSDEELAEDDQFWGLRKDCRCEIKTGRKGEVLERWKLHTLDCRQQCTQTAQPHVNKVNAQLEKDGYDMDTCYTAVTRSARYNKKGKAYGSTVRYTDIKLGNSGSVVKTKCPAQFVAEGPDTCVFDKVDSAHYYLTKTTVPLTYTLNRGSSPVGFFLQTDFYTGWSSWIVSEHRKFSGEFSHTRIVVRSNKKTTDSSGSDQCLAL